MEKMKYYDNKGRYCSISGCNKKARVKGLCMKCYTKMRKKAEVRHTEKRIKELHERMAKSKLHASKKRKY